MEAIKADNLTKRYDSFTAVDSISSKVEGGEIFGFLGPNGSGKSITISPHPAGRIFEIPIFMSRGHFKLCKLRANRAIRKSALFPTYPWNMHGS